MGVRGKCKNIINHDMRIQMKYNFRFLLML